MTLTIITINYNNRTGLQRTIDSVLCQTWKDYEWIVIDGGSTDGSKELIEQYQDCFAYWCSEPDKGVYNAMNKGIVQAKGKWVNFMNSGDSYFCQSTLQEVFAIDHRSDILYGDWIWVSPEMEKRVCAPTDKQLFSTLLTGNICHQAMFFRTELLFDRGYDETFSIYADWRRNVELLMAAARWELLPVVVCRFELGGLSGTMNREVTAAEYQRVAEVFPQGSVDVIQELPELEMYRSIRYYQYLRSLLDGNRLARTFTKATILLLYKLFAKR